MAAPTRTPRTSWIEEGLRALGVGGPDAVRIETLAQALGVTKGGFYWHFDGRPALLEEMLDAWERLVVDEVIESVEAGDGDARAKLRRLFALAASGGDLIKIELAIRDWSRRDRAVAKCLTRVDNRRMEYMRSLFGAFCPDEDDVEVRCLLVFQVFIGTHFIAADHGARSRADVMRLTMRRLLVQHAVLSNAEDESARAHKRESGRSSPCESALARLLRDGQHQIAAQGAGSSGGGDASAAETGKPIVVATATASSFTYRPKPKPSPHCAPSARRYAAAGFKRRMDEEHSG